MTIGSGGGSGFGLRDQRNPESAANKEALLPVPSPRAVQTPPQQGSAQPPLRGRTQAPPAEGTAGDAGVQAAQQVIHGEGGPRDAMAENVGPHGGELPTPGLTTAAPFSMPEPEREPIGPQSPDAVQRNQEALPQQETPPNSEDLGVTAQEASDYLAQGVADKRAQLLDQAGLSEEQLAGTLEALRRTNPNITEEQIIAGHLAGKKSYIGNVADTVGKQLLDARQQGSEAIAGKGEHVLSRGAGELSGLERVAKAVQAVGVTGVNTLFTPISYATGEIAQNQIMSPKVDPTTGEEQWAPGQQSIAQKLVNNMRTVGIDPFSGDSPNARLEIINQTLMDAWLHGTDEEARFAVPILVERGYLELLAGGGAQMLGTGVSLARNAARLATRVGGRIESVAAAGRAGAMQSAARAVERSEMAAPSAGARLAALAPSSQRISDLAARVTMQERAIAATIPQSLKSFATDETAGNGPLGTLIEGVQSKVDFGPAPQGMRDATGAGLAGGYFDPNTGKLNVDRAAIQKEAKAAGGRAFVGAVAHELVHAGQWLIQARRNKERWNSIDDIERLPSQVQEAVVRILGLPRESLTGEWTPEIKEAWKNGGLKGQIADALAKFVNSEEAGYPGSESSLPKTTLQRYADESQVRISAAKERSARDKKFYEQAIREDSARGSLGIGKSARERIAEIQDRSLGKVAKETPVKDVRFLANGPVNHSGWITQSGKVYMGSEARTPHAKILNDAGMVPKLVTDENALGFDDRSVDYGKNSGLIRIGVSGNADEPRFYIDVGQLNRLTSEQMQTLRALGKSHPRSELNYELPNGARGGHLADLETDINTNLGANPPKSIYSFGQEGSSNIANGPSRLGARIAGSINEETANKFFFGPDDPSKYDMFGFSYNGGGPTDTLSATERTRYASYTSASTGGEGAGKQLEVLGNVLIKNKAYQDSLSKRLKNYLPENVTVYRGGKITGMNRFFNASLSEKEGEFFGSLAGSSETRIKNQPLIKLPTTGKMVEGDVTAISIPREAIIGIGSSGEHEVIIDRNLLRVLTKGANKNASEAIGKFRQDLGQTEHDKVPAKASSAEHGDKVYQLTQANGGATYNLRDGDLTGQDRWAVGAYAERSVTIDGDATPGDISKFIDDNRETLQHSNVYSVGTWKNDGKTILDIVRTLANKDSAFSIARASNQDAIYNLKTGETIDTVDRMNLYHHSTQTGLSELSPSFEGSGTGLHTITEKTRMGEYGYTPKTHYYKEGTPAEYHVSSSAPNIYKTSIPSRNVYDMSKDPMGLISKHYGSTLDKQAGMIALEDAVKQAGYSGYHFSNPNEPQYGHVVMFDNMPVKQYAADGTVIPPKANTAAAPRDPLGGFKSPVFQKYKSVDGIVEALKNSGFNGIADFSAAVKNNSKSLAQAPDQLVEDFARGHIEKGLGPTAKEGDIVRVVKDYIKEVRSGSAKNLNDVITEELTGKPKGDGATAAAPSSELSLGEDGSGKPQLLPANDPKAPVGGITGIGADGHGAIGYGPLDPFAVQEGLGLKTETGLPLKESSVKERELIEPTATEGRAGTPLGLKSEGGLTIKPSAKVVGESIEPSGGIKQEGGPNALKLGLKTEGDYTLNLKEKIKGFSDLERSLEASTDDSFLLNQGYYAMWTHPKEFGSMTLDSFKSMTKDGLGRVNQSVNSLPSHDLAVRSGVRFDNPGDNEFFQSGTLERAKVIGPVIAGSDRMYTGAGNSIRGRLFDTYANAWGLMDVHNLEMGSPEYIKLMKDAKDLADYVNIITGVGDVSALPDVLQKIGPLFFAYKFTASKFNQLTSPFTYSMQAMRGSLPSRLPFGEHGMPTPLYLSPEHASSWRMAALAWRDLTLYAGGIGLTAAAMKASGLDVGLDPTQDSKFLQLQLGKGDNAQTWDLSGGMGKVFSLMFQTMPVLGSRTHTTKAGVKYSLDNVPFGQEDAVDLWTRFLTGKLAPMYSQGTQIVRGKNFQGSSPTPWDLMPLPITAKNAAELFFSEAWKNPGSWASVIGQGFGAHGYVKSTTNEPPGLLGQPIKNIFGGKTKAAPPVF